MSEEIEIPRCSDRYAQTTAVRQLAGRFGIEEEIAALLIEGRGRDAVIQFLEAAPLEEWMYLYILLEASRLAMREAK